MVRTARDNKDLAAKIGARIRHLRMGARMTQERLAWECDLSKGYLSKVEAGSNLPSLDVLARIAVRLNVELADMVATNLATPRLQLLEALRVGDTAGIDVALARCSVADARRAVP